MRIIADENFPEPAVLALRARGHTVVWVREDAPGSPDRDILARATAEGLLVITFDKDFGELAFRWGLPATSGILLFRISSKVPEDVARVAVAVLEARSDWAGHFSVLNDKRLRMRPLVPTSQG